MRTLAEPPKPIEARQGGAGKHHLQLLDALRGAAAFYVVCHHARLLLFAGVHDTNATTPVATRLLAVCLNCFTFGHQAVVLFFVLSGFCIHLRQAEALRDARLFGQNARFQPLPYLGRRIRRIAPPYYFALAFTAVIDYATRQITNRSVSQLTSRPYLWDMVQQHNSWATLAGNLAFLQHLCCATFGNDSALWSLSFEFFFYLLYPLFWRIRTALGVWKSAALVLGVSALAIGVEQSAPHLNLFFLPIACYWFTWVLGAAAADVYAGNATVARSLRNPWTGCALGFIWLATTRLLTPDLSDTLGAFACAHLILLCLRDHDRRISAGTTAYGLVTALAGLGRFSYSLYLTHLPVIVFICCVWARSHSELPTAPWVFLIGIAAAIAVGYTSYWLVERHTVSADSRKRK